VRERFLDRLDERLDRIRLAMARAPADPLATTDLRREVHSLIGSAGTLGFHDLAAAAEAVDRSMRDGDEPDTTAGRLALLVACVEAYARQRAHA